MQDCRTITGKGICKYLYQWRSKMGPDISDVCTCKALNSVIFPDFRKYGKVDQELIGIKPLFDCPYMQELRVKGLLPSYMATITSTGYDKKL